MTHPFLATLLRFLKDLRLQSDSLNAPVKRSGEDLGTEAQPTGKRPRGRPKGSKTKPKPTPAAPAASKAAVAATTTSTPQPGGGETAPPAA